MRLVSSACFALALAAACSSNPVAPAQPVTLGCSGPSHAGAPDMSGCWTAQFNSDYLAWVTLAQQDSVLTGTGSWWGSAINANGALAARGSDVGDRVALTLTYSSGKVVQINGTRVDPDHVQADGYVMTRQ